MELEVRLGIDIYKVARQAVDLVAAGELVVSFTFNDITLTVAPGMNADDVVAEYERQSQVRREVYISSPEYKERQRQGIERERQRAAALAAALAKAPAKMTLRDPEGWAKRCATNKDGYGGAVMSYAERWARVMEGMIADGVGVVEATAVSHCADEASHLADVEGITGFMYGCAVSVLSQVWIHGEALRRWHNKATQLGDEGDKANESGGVLNPALLRMG